MSIQIRNGYGLYDEIIHLNGIRTRNCNWIRFLRVADTFEPQVSKEKIVIFICRMIEGDKKCCKIK